ncbi:hypothetical protein L9F63_010360, partial [Diploptera punctata]
MWDVERELLCAPGHSGTDSSSSSGSLSPRAPLALHDEDTTNSLHEERTSTAILQATEPISLQAQECAKEYNYVDNDVLQGQNSNPAELQSLDFNALQKHVSSTDLHPLCISDLQEVESSVEIPSSDISAPQEEVDSTGLNSQGQSALQEEIRPTGLQSEDSNTLEEYIGSRVVHFQRTNGHQEQVGSTGLHPREPSTLKEEISPAGLQSQDCSYFEEDVDSRVVHFQRTNGHQEQLDPTELHTQEPNVVQDGVFSTGFCSQDSSALQKQVGFTGFHSQGLNDLQEEMDSTGVHSQDTSTLQEKIGSTGLYSQSTNPLQKKEGGCARETAAQGCYRGPQHFSVVSEKSASGKTDSTNVTLIFHREKRTSYFVKGNTDFENKKGKLFQESEKFHTRRRTQQVRRYRTGKRTPWGLHNARQVHSKICTQAYWQRGPPQEEQYSAAPAPATPSSCRPQEETPRT